MIILLVLLACLVGAALLMGEKLQSSTIVTHVFQPDSPATFYLTDEDRNLDIIAIEHPCLMYLKNMYSVKHGRIIASAWVANAVYSAHNRQILITDFSTGISCGFSDEYSRP